MDDERRRSRWLDSARRGLRQWAMVTATALIAVVTSERLFWYYTDAEPVSLAELAIYYSIAVYAVFWCCHRFRVDGLVALVAAVPVFGYVVEGVITPILYSGGPTPLFPLWFTAWHGGLGILLAWFGVRRLLLDGRAGALALLAGGLGWFWGNWATTLWLPENLNDPELAESAPRIRELADFAGYTAASTLALVVGHVVLDRVWVRDYRPSRSSAILVGGIILTMVVAYTVAIPWAAPMFVALLGLVAWVLRGRRDRVAGEPDGSATIFRSLDGRIRWRSLPALAALPAIAVPVHAMWFAIDPPLVVLRVVLYGTIAIQCLLATGALVWSARRLAAERRVAAADAPAGSEDGDPGHLGAPQASVIDG